MSQAVYSEEEAFFEVNLPQDVHSAMPISAVYFPQHSAGTEKKAASMEAAAKTVISIANSTLEVVQLKEEVKTEAMLHEWVTLDFVQKVKGSEKMHALKNEHADDRFQDATTPVVNIVKSDAAEKTEHPPVSPIMAINKDGNRSYLETDDTQTKPLKTPAVSSEDDGVPSLPLSGGDKQTMRSRIVPSIDTPLFQASVVEGETSSEESIVILTGRVDHEQFPILEDFLNHVIQKNTTKLFCDVGGLTSINSSGWGLLVAELQRLRKRGGNLFLCGLQGETEQIFKVLELDKLFLTFRTVSDAMRNAAPEPGNIRPFPKAKSQGAQSADNPAYLPLEEKIQRIVAENPYLSAGGIHKLLRSETYGNTKISGWGLVSKLRSMNLGTKEDRYRFFRSS